MSTSNVKAVLMAAKLKEGVQDTIVYLRMLEGAKLPAVYERKRKQLMDQLLDLQGDTIKEAPPKLGSDDEEDDDIPAPQQPVKMRNKTVENKSRVASSSISDRTSKFEKPGGGKNFKYKTLEELKKARNSVSMEDKEEESKGDAVSPTSPAAPEETATTKEQKDTTKTDPIPEEPSKNFLEVDGKPSPTSSANSTPSGTPEAKRKNRASSLAGGLMKKMKKQLKHDVHKDRSSSLNETTSMENIGEKQQSNEGLELDEEDEGESTPAAPQVNGVTEEIEQIEEEPTAMIEEEPEEEEDGGDKPAFTSLVEKVTKRLGRYSYQKVEMTLLPEAVVYRKPGQNESKNTEISLIGAASAIRDSYQFELHTPYKSYTFRTETEELCAKWVSGLGEAIDACNPSPIEEEPPSVDEGSTNKDVEVPQITVSNSQEGSPVKQGNIRNSSSYENFTSPNSQKKSGKKEMPDFSAAQVKGYMHKKGTFSKWEKVWMGLHHDNSLYITTNESNKRIMSTVAITTETKIDKKKGSDKLPHAFTVTTGKTKDTFATDSFQDFTTWLYCLEQASAGPYDIQELLSEDEDDGGELYEELGAEEQPKLPSAPIPPRSPRPAPYQQSHPPEPIDEEIYEDGFDDGGDIYEGLDDVEMPPTRPAPQQQPPPPISSLPPHRGSTDSGNTIQPPSLPPRNAPPTLPPSLPPRSTRSDSTPQDYEAPKTIPQQKNMEIEEEVYDDVVTAADDGDELEETYDDVESVAPPPKKPAAPQPQQTPPKRPPLPKVVSSEELYEDMAPEGIELEEDEEYSEMMPGGGDPEPIDEDFYDDVSAPPPPRPPKAVTTTTTTTVTKPPPPVTSASVKPPPTKTTTLPKTSSSTSPGVKRNSFEDKKSATPGASPSASVKKSSTLPNRPSSAGTATKRLNTTGKVAQMSKMFGQSDDSLDKQQKSPTTPKKASQSGTLMYKSPGKVTYASNHCVLDGTILVFYAAATDKLSHYRLSLRDATLKLGSPDGKGAKYTFEMLKGKVTHSFSVSAREDFISWMAALVTASQKVSPDKPDLFSASKDHNSSKSGEISFKKDAVLWVILRDSQDTWTGIVGTSESTFENVAGSFPSSCVNPLMNEDVYI